jgi:hypothetical protein
MYPGNARIKKEGKEGFSSSSASVIVMVTKPLTRYKEAKVKGYVHWPVDRWIRIQEEAREKDIPNHWVIMDYQEFIYSKPALEDEFRRFLNKKYPKKIVQKGVTSSTNRRDGLIERCPLCNIPGSSMYIDRHILKCTGRRQQPERFQEVLVTK